MLCLFQGLIFEPVHSSCPFISPKSLWDIKLHFFKWESLPLPAFSETVSLFDVGKAVPHTDLQKILRVVLLAWFSRLPHDPFVYLFTLCLISICGRDLKLSLSLARPLVPNCLGFTLPPVMLSPYHFYPLLLTGVTYLTLLQGAPYYIP